MDNNHVTKLGELKQLIDGLWSKVTTAISNAVSGLLSKSEADAAYQAKGSYATQSELNSLGNTFSGEIGGIKSKIPANASETNKLATAADIPTVPTNVSAFENDVGYITSETDPVFSASAAAGISSDDIASWNAGSQPEVFWCEYGVTPPADIDAAYRAGKICKVKLNASADGYAIATLSRTNGIEFYFDSPVVDSQSKHYYCDCSYRSAASELNGWSNVTTENLSKADGSNATGTWGIGISGNAATATSARTVARRFSRSASSYGIHIGSTTTDSAGNVTSLLAGSYSLMQNIAGGLTGIGENKVQTGRFAIFHRGTTRQARIWGLNAYSRDKVAIGYRVTSSDPLTVDWYILWGSTTESNVSKSFSRVSVTFDDILNAIADYDLTFITSELDIASIPMVYVPFVTGARHQGDSGNKQIGSLERGVFIDSDGEIMPCSYGIKITSTPGTDSSTIYFV